MRTVAGRSSRRLLSRRTFELVSSRLASLIMYMWFVATNIDEFRSTHTETCWQAHIARPKASKHQPVFHLSRSLSIFLSLLVFIRSVGRMVGWLNAEVNSHLFLYLFCSLFCNFGVLSSVGFFISVGGTLSIRMFRMHTQSTENEKKSNWIRHWRDSILFSLTVAFDVLFFDVKLRTQSVCACTAQTYTAQMFCWSGRPFVFVWIAIERETHRLHHCKGFVSITLLLLLFLCRFHFHFGVLDTWRRFR